ncbi:alpha/beta fold hydrolase [Paenibacillus eucommiae]|uniref:Pimeloyl-ACP methyl ester carboxylesterase n=1 Tax=Paenibacillus eucommiae TaxID=1355755 RepID=A0ABS4IY52_9BACL|nr:alpha/beta hydrolase [Paenibacillus eucommiae]MBP1992005.1 pimeloyl-ACP methyl ester carboxylesterase [Paenibacillus eucommiae]
MPFLEVNGTLLHYHITGKGIPLVLIHPSLLSAQVFNYQKAQLSDSFQVITFDIRGHGESLPSRRKLTYPLIAEDIRQLLDALDIRKAYLCGYSVGASIVLEALLAYPDRFLGGIIVSGTSEITDRLNKSLLWMSTKLSSLSPLRNVLASAISLGNADMPLTYRNLRRSSLHGDPDNIREYFEYSLHYNCTQRLHAIRHPILLIYGQKNTNFHPYAHILHDHLPNSSLYFIKGARHQLPTKNARRMNELLRLWVNSLENQDLKRTDLDLQIAQQLNPEQYMKNEEGEGLSAR